MTTTPATPAARGTATDRHRPSVWRAGLVTAAVAALAVTLVWLVGQATPASWEVEQAGSTMQVPAFMPAVAAVMGVVVGTVGLWLLARFPWGLTVWTVLAVLVGLGSAPQPLLAASDTWTGVLLSLMHVVVLVVALVLLRPAGRHA